MSMNEFPNIFINLAAINPGPQLVIIRMFCRFKHEAQPIWEPLNSLHILTEFVCYQYLFLTRSEQLQFVVSQFISHKETILQNKVAAETGNPFSFHRNPQEHSIRHDNITKYITSKSTNSVPELKNLNRGTSSLKNDNGTKKLIIRRMNIEVHSFIF